MLVAGGLVVGLLWPGMPTDLRVACNGFAVGLTVWSMLSALMGR